MNLGLLPHPPHRSNLPVAFLAVAGLGILARCLVVWSGWVEGTIISDDAYYYFQIASNLAAGKGPTFDGLAPTNGFHPLWLWILVPLYQVPWSSLWTPVKLAITLSTLLDLGTGLLLYLILRRLSGDRGALVSALFWFLSPFTLLLGLRGMEASLSAFLLTLVFWRLAGIAGRGAGPGLPDGVGIGLLWGLAGLARTDSLPAIGLALCAFAVARGRSDRRLWPIRPLGWLVVAGACALLVVLPWFLWNLSNFGTLVQVSGLAKLHFRIGHAWEMDWTSIGGVLRTLVKAAATPLVSAARFACLEEFSSPRVSALAGLLLVGGVLLPWLVAGRTILARTRGTPAGMLAVTAATYMAVHTVLFGVVWRAYMNWYALGYLAAYTLILALTLGAWREADRMGIRRTGGALLFLVAFSAFLYVRFLSGIQLGPAHVQKVFGARYEVLAERYPQGVTAGGFNAGAVGYFASEYGDITVINLDGLVNNLAYRAAREGRFSGYVRDHVEVMLEPLQNGAYLFREGEMDSLARIYRRWPGQDLWSPDPPGAAP